MMKVSGLLCLLLIFSASAEILEFDNNFIEYGPAPSISIPYPYQAIETVAAPVYETVVVPTVTTEIEPAGFISTAISCTLSAAKTILVFLLTNGPALIAGTAVALGVCKLTTVCDSQITIYEAQTELRSLATPERLSRAAKFVAEAVKKFKEMQKK